MNPLDESMYDAEYRPIPPWSTALKYGLIGGAAVVVTSIFSFIIIERMSAVASNLVSLGFAGLLLAIYILIMVFSIKEYRDRFLKGYISLGQGILVSYGSAMFMGIAGLLFSLLYLLVIDPGYTERLFTKQYGEFIDISASGSGAVLVSPVMVLSTQIGSFVIGCIVGIVTSLIISAIMKKDRPFNSASR